MNRSLSTGLSKFLIEPATPPWSNFEYDLLSRSHDAQKMPIMGRAELPILNTIVTSFKTGLGRITYGICPHSSASWKPPLSVGRIVKLSAVLGSDFLSLDPDRLPWDLSHLRGLNKKPKNQRKWTEIKSPKWNRWTWTVVKNSSRLAFQWASTKDNDAQKRFNMIDTQTQWCPRQKELKKKILAAYKGLSHWYGPASGAMPTLITLQTNEVCLGCDVHLWLLPRYEGSGLNLSLRMVFFNGKVEEVCYPCDSYYRSDPKAPYVITSARCPVKLSTRPLLENPST